LRQRIRTAFARAPPARGVASAAVKAELRASTDRALRLGVIGVPTTRVADQLFWGDDRLPDVARRR
jgi:2-hydroxychromene-2-carboxylate isomerase